MEDLKGGQPNETARKKKKRIEMKNLSSRPYTAQETMSEVEDRSEEIQQWPETYLDSIFKSRDITLPTRFV